MVFHLGLSESKSPQVTGILLADFINAIIWMASISSPFSYSSTSYTKPLGTIPDTKITIGTTVTFKFFNYLSSLARSKYLSLFFFLWFSLCGLLRWQNQVDGKFSFLFLFFVNYHLIWHYYYYYHYLVLWESFTLALANVFSLEFEWQQVSLSLQDSSQYSGWS